MTMAINSNTVQEFCKYHNYFNAGSVYSFRKLLDLADLADSSDLDAIAAIIWVNTNDDTMPGDGFYSLPLEQIKSQLEEELDSDWTEKKAAKACYENNSRLINRIIEVSKWSPAITQAVTSENCVLLESGGVGDELNWVSFRVNGIGFTIDFECHTASRNPDYDAGIYGE